MIVWVVLSVLAALAAGGALLARLGWPFELIGSLLPQLGAIALLLALSFSLVGRPVSAVLAVAIAALCAFGARELFLPATPVLEQRDVRVVWANLLGEPAALQRVMRLAAEQQADIVVLAEYPYETSLEEARPFLGPYMHHAGTPTVDHVKIAVFSRHPLLSAEPIGIGWRRNRQALVVTIDTARGPLRVIGVHPAVPATPRAQRSRDEAARLAFARLSVGGPAVLVGDLNAVSWSPLIRGAVADGAITRAHLGWRSTWWAPIPVLGLPIDHAFAAGGARISARVGPGTGSDHLPLVVDIALRP